MKKIRRPPEDPGSLETSESFLQPYLPKISQVIRSGWRAWEDFGADSPQHRVPLRPVTRANFVYDHIVDAALQAFDGEYAVKIGTSRGFLEINIEGVYLLRFKKLDRRGRSRGIPTGQKKLWSDAEMTLPGMPPEIVRLIAGYQLDSFGHSIERVLVTRPDGDNVQWKIPITHMASTSNVFEIPQSEPKSAVPRSSLKSLDKKKKEEDKTE